ncbi:MAG: hypothetical protein K9K64_12385 [Desulfohalobiaceae bacterium]|nr:hypothetical protein [Desulfohalobiaceae bacterium]
MARIRIKHKPPKPKSTSKQELLDMAKVAEEIAKEHSPEQQLKLPLELDPELKQKQEELAETKPPEAKTKTEEQFIEELQHGARISFAGELMHHLFLQEIGFKELLSCYPYQFGSRYQALDTLGTIFHSINLGFPSIESLKLANAGDPGLLIGQPRAPEKETLQGLFGRLASQEKSPQLIEYFARNLLEKERIEKEVFFIDGHFLPYYGLHVIAKGYYTVRRMPLKGNEIYAVTDLQGRPLFFLTESCEIDLRKYKLGDRQDKRIEKKIIKLEQEKTEKETELQRFETRLSQLPDKISILELLKGRAMNRCDLEKKKLYDLMQCLAFHSRERLVEIFRDCYDDPRDIKQILGMITRRSGLIKLIGDSLVVILDGIDNKKYRKAADKLCHKLNEQEITLIGRLKVKLSFHLNKIRNRKFVPIEGA